MKDLFPQVGDAAPLVYERGLNRHRNVAVICGLLLSCGGVSAQEALATESASAGSQQDSGATQPDPPDSDPFAASSDPADPFSSQAGMLDLVSGESLLFAEFETVVSASRTEQQVSLAPAAVSIISGEDLYRSGAREIQDALLTVPGVDALRVDRNRWAVGVRGLHQVFSDRTLLLINGRNANNSVTGGIDLQTLPVMLPDIERIEVVRGPASGAWGANAFNGVINIIERRPRDTQGLLARTRVNEFGDVVNTARIGRVSDRFAWRFTAEHSEFEASGSPYTNNGTVVAPATADDFFRSRAFKTVAEYLVTDTATLEASFAYKHLERGDSPFLNFQLGDDERSDLFTAHTKFSDTFGDSGSFFVQWQGTAHDIDRPSNWRYTAYDNIFDTLIEFDANENHSISVGSSLRLINIAAQQARATDALPGGASAEQFFGVYLRDEWRLGERWTLDSQVRTDWYSETEWDWASRIALMQALDNDARHVVRYAFARSFRTPQAGLRELESQRIPVPGSPGLFGLDVIRPEELNNESIMAAEVGFTSRPNENVRFTADGYYQILDDLTGVQTLAPGFPGQFRGNAATLGGATAYGAEVTASYRVNEFGIDGWYAYNGFDFDQPNQNARGFRPAPHKIGARLLVEPFEWLNTSIAYRYTAPTPGDRNNPGVGDFHQLDLTGTVTVPLAQSRVDIQLGVRDVLDSTDRLVFDETAPGVASETPGQTFFLQAQFTH